AENPDARLELRIDAERVAVLRHEACQQQAAGAHAAYEGGEQHPERDGGRPNDQLEELKPDDLVNQRRTAASDEQQQQGGQKSRFRHGTPARLLYPLYRFTVIDTPADA